MSSLPLQGLADWLLTFAIHSTCMLAFALVISFGLRQRGLVWQERMLRFALWAALASSTAQFVFATTPMSLSLATPVTEVAAPAVDAGDLLALGPPIAELLPAAPPARPWSVATWMVAVAALMMLLGCAWLLRLHSRLRSVLRTREPETDGRTLTLAAEAARSLGLRQSPHVSRSADILTPIAFGCLRPEICLPLRARSLADDELRAMLAHEVAHLRRLDPVWMWVAAGLNAVFPWQLLFVVARRRWSQLVEMRCDAIAANQTSPTAVARCLLDVAEWLKPPARVPAVALGMAARPSALRLRVETALHRGAAGRLSRGWSLGFGGVSLSALTFVAPGVNSAARSIGLPDEAAVVLAPDDAKAATPLQSTLLLLRNEQTQLQDELEQLRARARTQRNNPELEQLLAQIAERLLAVERSCQQVQALIDRREFSDTPLQSR